MQVSSLLLHPPLPHFRGFPGPYLFFLSRFSFVTLLIRVLPLHLLLRLSIFLICSAKRVSQYLI